MLDAILVVGTSACLIYLAFLIGHGIGWLLGKVKDRAKVS